ncbi:MAG: hypothetical protein COB45_14115 [Gammaproteobacteria bacterium]|jgi:hypothetical protein|nr:MAG: hypothetical protein COB45_14115 [Gammaproteobacteria bacterium]PHR80492.1 MAG: hypothetical protein COA59_17470 [Colwellia sp.]
MEEFIFRVIVGVLGAISAVIITKLWKDWQYKRGELTGEWVQIIYDNNENIKKTDSVQLKHNHFTKKVTGKICRKSPDEESKKEWIFEGIIRGNVLFMIFWSKDVSINPGSHGTIQLNEVNESELTGFYIRPNSAGQDSQILNVLDKTTIEWKRKV